MKNLLQLMLVSSALVSGYAHAATPFSFDNESSKAIYKALKVAVEDKDDILVKDFHSADNQFGIRCEKYVVDKTFSCVVNLSKLSLENDDAKSLYSALKIKAEDNDDITTKTLAVPGMIVDCDRSVVEKTYACRVALLVVLRRTSS